MNTQNAIAQNDEIDLNDLFAEIDGAVLEPTVEAVAPDTSDEIDLSLLLDQVEQAEAAPVVEAKPVMVEEVPAEPVKAEAAPESDPELDLDLLLEVAAEEEKSPVTETASNEDILNDLFDEAELDASSLTLAVEEAPAVEEPKVEEKPAKQKKEKAPTTYRTTYQNSKRSAVLLDRLGGDTNEIVLEFSDVELPEQELKEKQQKFLRLLNAQPTLTTNGETVQKKVAEKVVILFTMFKQNGRWNEVMYRTFKLLLTDGYISGGRDSNLVKDLLAKPYSIGTARAQAGQMMQMLPLLKIAKEEGGRLVPNEESTILARLRDQYFPELPKKDAA
ncbi:hypothetical protein ACNAUY_07970 [Acinetobacter tibetensis]|uniref:hypothetical protein n=1 Tax=Acinetobacter tibetensis TaxID=2943497 RepID=UPI003A4E0578